MINIMQNAKSISKYIRITPTKLSLVLNKIRNKSYIEALAILKFLPQKGAKAVWKALYSAAANAVHKNSIIKENLLISKAYANKGPILKRTQPRAKGRAFKIEKKMSHITICLSELSSTK
jgi:large subunit ribosomal protein L22